MGSSFSRGGGTKDAGSGEARENEGEGDRDGDRDKDADIDGVGEREGPVMWSVRWADMAGRIAGLRTAGDARWSSACLMPLFKFVISSFGIRACGCGGRSRW